MRKNLKILNHAYAYSKIKMVYYVGKEDLVTHRYNLIRKVPLY